jgi:CO/xanthine dehydrogenase FAD-binding subunit
MKRSLHRGGGVYRRPRELGQALAALASERCAVLAGGTDFHPARLGRPVDDALLDLSRVAALHGIDREADGGWRIGAATSWTALVRAGLPPRFDALVQAALEVGGPQVQNRGTIGGNLCNASAAADGVPPLLALDAEVELASVRGARRLPLADFVLGPRRTALAPDELLVAVRVPPAGAGARSRFLKLGHRRYLVISVVAVAAAADVDDAGRARRVAVAVGACSPVARRLPALEAVLEGLPVASLGARASAALPEDAPGLLAPLAPIDDVRGTAAYRREAAATLVARALAELAR